MKRKGAKDGEQSSKKKKVEGGDQCKIKTSSPEDCLKSLLSPNDIEIFFAKYWEKSHLYIKREDPKYYGNLFSLDEFHSILESEDVSYGVELNVCRYVDKGKEDLNEEGFAKSKEVKAKFEKEKATLQFHQPQRFGDQLWSIMENLERYFGCSFGANCYITPEDSQGLAPHFDDVEVFILQLEGKKSWKLYKPTEELSNHYSPDLKEEDIGSPIFEQTLEAGDLLYFPRGTIHQAKATGKGHSTHVTLSTYQSFSMGDFLSAAFQHCVEEAMEKDVEFRRGLPINFLSFLGTGKNVSNYVTEETDENKGEDAMEETDSNESSDEKIVELKRKMKDLLTRLIDHVDLNVAADSLSEDFMASRLPPYLPDADDDADKEEITPTLSSLIKIKHPDHVRLIIYSDDSEDEDSDDESDFEEVDSEEAEEAPPNEEKDSKKSGKKKRPKTRSNSTDGAKGKPRPSGKKDEKQKKDTSKDEPMEDVTSEDDDDDDDIGDMDASGPHITVLHSLHNDRRAHMLGDVREGGIKLPLHFAKAVQYVLDHHDQFLKVQELPLAEDRDKITLAESLWSDGILDVKSE